MNYTEYALIVAGGKGTRIGSAVPKQFLELNGLPVVMHTVRAFYRYSEKITIILVLPEADLAVWQTLCKKHSFHKPLILEHGGKTRFQSVKNGLGKIDGDGLVAIHDGVRPLVSNDIIDTSFRLASVHRSAIAAVRLKESIRITDGSGTKAVDRSLFHLIQTPQTFQVGAIKAAYQSAEDPGLTDDASVAERAGIPVTLFDGSYENIKITTREDLLIAEALLKNKQNV